MELGNFLLESLESGCLIHADRVPYVRIPRPREFWPKSCSVSHQKYLVEMIDGKFKAIQM